MDAPAGMAERAYVALSLAFVPPMYLMVIGLLWTPFAALICLAVARAKRLEGEGAKSWDKTAEKRWEEKDRRDAQGCALGCG